MLKLQLSKCRGTPWFIMHNYTFICNSSQKANRRNFCLCSFFCPPVDKEVPLWAVYWFLYLVMSWPVWCVFVSVTFSNISRMKNWAVENVKCSLCSIFLSLTLCSVSHRHSHNCNEFFFSDIWSYSCGASSKKCKCLLCVKITILCEHITIFCLQLCVLSNYLEGTSYSFVDIR